MTRATKPEYINDPEILRALNSHKNRPGNPFFSPEPLSGIWTSTKKNVIFDICWMTGVY